MGRVLISVLLLALSYGALESCEQDLAKVLSKFLSFEPSDVYSAMAFHSGKYANDLGDYYSCIALEGAEYVLFSVPFQYSKVMLGLCGPQSCTKENYLAIIDYLSGSSQTNHSLSLFSSQIRSLFALEAPIEGLHQPAPSLNIIFPEQYIHENFTSLSGGAIVMLLVCILLVLMTAAGTIIDVLQSTKKPIAKKTVQFELMEIDEAKMVANDGKEHFLPSMESAPSLSISILLCFSLYTNLPKLLTSRSSEKLGQKKDSLDILNGVRVMSLGWVILGHLYASRIGSPMKNPMVVIEIAQAFKTAFVYGGVFAVDTFFWISGFLMSYLILQQLSSATSFTFRDWISIYVHRFYRILPTYSFVLFLLWAFTKYLGNGPMWFQGDDMNIGCPSYWWSSLLFLNDFIPRKETGCFGVGWYLANDMQFFIITPPMLYLYHHIHRLWGWLILTALCGCAILSSCLIADAYGYNAVMYAANNLRDGFMSNIYVKPYCRIAPYALGLACGMILFSYRHHKKTDAVYDQYALTLGTFLEAPKVRYCSFCLGLFLISFLICIQYDAYNDVENLWTTWCQTANILFIGFNHFLWGVALSLLLLPMLQGFCLIPTWFLSLELWTPLARLSFCVYLIHIHLIGIYTLSINAAYWFNDLNFVVDLIFITLVSYAVAVPLTLLVESPCMALEKLMRSRVKNSRESN